MVPKYSDHNNPIPPLPRRWIIRSLLPLPRTQRRAQPRRRFALWWSHRDGWMRNRRVRRVDGEGWSRGR